MVFTDNGRNLNLRCSVSLEITTILKITSCLARSFIAAKISVNVFVEKKNWQNLLPKKDFEKCYVLVTEATYLSIKPSDPGVEETYQMEQVVVAAATALSEDSASVQLSTRPCAGTCSPPWPAM